MKGIRHIICAIALTGAVNAALATPVATQQPDSAQQSRQTATALATYWAEYLRPALARDNTSSGAALEQYIEGVRRAMTIDPAQAVYYRGIFEGLSLVRNLDQMQEMGVMPDRDVFVSTLATALAGGSTGMTAREADEYLSGVFRGEAAAPDTVSVASQDAFLAAASAREGAVTTPSGLVFEVITEGEGPTPSREQTAQLFYTGSLSDGTVFDATDEAIDLPLGHLVPGMTEGLLMTRPGGTYRLTIPSDLAYGPNGISGVIPGNAALQFEVRILNFHD